jgi:hypothetical protein
MKTAFKRLALIPVLITALACPGEKRKDVAQVPVDSTKADTAVDTTHTDLSKIKTNLPAANPVTSPPERVTRTASNSGLGAPSRSTFPDAPTPLVDAVQREQSATRFCFTEFGQKADPTLRGNVAMLVTIGGSGVTDAEVADSRWTGNAGRAVNRCLNQKAKQAWNVSPGAVKPGRYVVQLSFTGSQQ